MERKLFIAKTKSDLEKCYPIIKELRPHLSLEEYYSIYEQAQRADGYSLVAIQEGDQVLAVMGYRILSDFVQGKHIYIDDLVSTEKARSMGLGSELLKYAETVAVNLGCRVLRLCTGIENEGGVRFYEKNNWIKRAFAYTKKI